MGEDYNLGEDGFKGRGGGGGTASVVVVYELGKLMKCSVNMGCWFILKIQNGRHSCFNL